MKMAEKIGIDVEAGLGVKPAEFDHFHELIIHEEFGHMLIPSWSDGLCAGSAVGSIRIELFCDFCELSLLK